VFEGAVGGTDLEHTFSGQIEGSLSKVVELVQTEARENAESRLKDNKRGIETIEVYEV